MSSSGNIVVYDSVFHDVDNTTLKTLSDLFDFSGVKVAEFQKQVGGKDCGVFAIAATTQILLTGDACQKLNQETLRPHVLKCFEQGFFSSFL